MSVVDLLPPGAWSRASPDAEQQLAALQQRVGHPLPPDLRELHRLCTDVSLAEDRYRFISPEAMRPIAELQMGDATDDWAPRTWLAVVDLEDGNYVGVDLIPNADGSYNWLDCDHEDVGKAAIIATSLDEFVREALSHPDALYWLKPGHGPYRQLRYENPPSFWRKLHRDWYASLGDEVGPGGCVTGDCTRLRITHSTMCRKHHYEMVQRRPSPFEEA